MDNVATMMMTMASAMEHTAARMHIFFRDFCCERGTRGGKEERRKEEEVMVKVGLTFSQQQKQEQQQQ